MEAPEYLYHGTSGRRLRAILKHGLKPRGEGASQWSNAPSRPDHVYLTSSYAIYFARSAAYEDEQRQPGAVLRINVAKIGTDKLYADEDAMEQSNRTADLARWPDADMKWRTNFYRDSWHLLDVARRWDSSLAILGNCSHHGVIPPDAIDAVAVFPTNAPISMLCDPSISVMNYHLLGHYYRGLTAFPFDDGADAERELAACKTAPGMASISESHLDRLLANKDKVREGLRVAYSDGPWKMAIAARLLA